MQSQKLSLNSAALTLNEWAKSPTPDHARLIIRFYDESEWREHRLLAVRALEWFTDSRSFQFLIEIAQGLRLPRDISEQEIALDTLSRRKSPSVLRFLKHFYSMAPTELKPALVRAFGRVGNASVHALLRSELKLALTQRDPYLVRYLILTLSELKDQAAIPLIRDALLQSDPETQIPALLALGRMDRDSSFLQEHAPDFTDDYLLEQVFQNVSAQIAIRSQFKLEDYLSKIHVLPHPHSSLPLELRTFLPDDVLLGLDLLDAKVDWKKILFAATGLDDAARLKLFLRLSDALQLDHAESALRVPFFETCMAYHLTLEGDSTTQASAVKWAQSIFQVSTKNAQKNAQESLLGLQWITQLLGSKQGAVNWQETGRKFFESSTHAISFINVWAEAHLFAAHSAPIAHADSWLNEKLPVEVLARLFRAFAELGLKSDVILKSANQILSHSTGSDECLKSVLLWAERFLSSWPDQLVKHCVNGLNAANAAVFSSRYWSCLEQVDWTESTVTDQSRALTPLIVSVLRSTDLKSADLKSAALKSAALKSDSSDDSLMSVLRLVRKLPCSEFESLLEPLLQHSDSKVKLQAVIALKFFPQSKTSGEALLKVLHEAAPDSIFAGRALDAVLANTTLISKRGSLLYLTKHLNYPAIVDKFFRAFDPDQKGGSEFVQVMDLCLRDHPEHEAWEKLVALRDRLSLRNSPTVVSAAIQPKVDQILVGQLSAFHSLDPLIQSALRAAEIPFLESENSAENTLNVDKAPSVLEYCKALDLLLDQTLGRKYLFPKVDQAIADFQTVWHRLGFREDYPSADHVLKVAGLQGKISIELFPLHKAKLMAGTFFNGKIQQDRFKVFDGLRAWAVIFLLFARKLPGESTPTLKIPGITDEVAISMAKRLMMLQDLRNPAAHRQTYTDWVMVKNVRKEAFDMMNVILGAGK